MESAAQFSMENAIVNVKLYIEENTILLLD